MRARASGVKSAAELPIRKFIPDSNTSKKSCAKVNGTNPAAIFSDAGPSSCVRPSSYRATPAESKTSGRNGKVASVASNRPVAGQSAVTRKRSPWRPTDVKPVYSSGTDVGRNGARKRCPSVSPEVHRRSIDRTRVSSTSGVRRTRSVPATSTTLDGRNNDLPQTPPPLIIQPSSRNRSRSSGETQPAERTPSKLPRPVVPTVHSTKQTLATPKDKLTASDVIAQAVNLVKTAWDKVLKVGGPPVRGRFLPVLAALFFVVIAIIGRCVYITHMNTAPAPRPTQEFSPPQSLQPSREELVSSSQSESIWSWFN